MCKADPSSRPGANADESREVPTGGGDGGQAAASVATRVVTRPRRRPFGNREWMLIGGAIFALLALCTIGGFVWLGRDLDSLVKERDQPGTVVQEYMRSVQAHDWVRAQDSLSASLRKQNSPTILQAAWTQREQSNGTVTGFAETNWNVRVINGQRQATIVGTVGYSKVAPEAKVLNLIKEDGTWKLATLP
jgi:hypothetical protein